MKHLINIFLDQFRSKEIWTRVWELNRFHTFRTGQEWKKTSLRLISKEDVPAIIVSTLIVIALIALLSILFQGRKLTYALLALICLVTIISKFVKPTRKQKQDNNDGVR